MLSGQVQIAHLGGSATLSATAEGGDLVVISITGPVCPFVFMAPAAISNIDQIKGKKIGVSNVGSSSDIATRVMLKKVGLDPEKDVSIVAVGSLQNRMAALLNGVGTVTPLYPVVRADLFGDAVEQLSATDDKIKTFDLNKILDNQYVQSAMDRKVGGP